MQQRRRDGRLPRPVWSRKDHDARTRLGHGMRRLQIGEVTHGKCPAGPGLQVSLETECGGGVRELHADDYAPWAVSGGVNILPCVMPFQSCLDTRRETDVMALGIDLAAKNVDEPFDHASEMSA